MTPASSGRALRRSHRRKPERTSSRRCTPARTSRTCVTWTSAEPADGSSPGPGAAAEPGGGRGPGYPVTLPLSRGTADAPFLAALDLALARVRAYRPEILILLFGTDGHAEDPFAHLELTDGAYAAIAERAHALAHQICGGALVVLG